MIFPPHFFSRKLSIEEKSQVWDAYYNFPRPINEQHLSSYKAFLRLSKDYSMIAAYLIATLGSLLCLFYLWLKLGEIGVPFSSFGRWIPFVIAGAIVIGAFFIDRTSVFVAYYSMFQRDAMGSAKWATETRLRDKNLISRNDETVVPDRIPLVPFGTKHNVSMPVGVFAQHGIVIGPSGCAKTTGFFMSIARHFSRIGGMIALDIAKDVAGEFYAYTAHYFDDAYRFDLMNPAYTDCFDVFGFCKNSAVNSGKVAKYIIGSGSGKGGEIWDLAAEGMLKCLLLHLSSTKDEGSPSDIFDFLATHPTDDVDDEGEPVNRLKEVMEASEIEDVRIEWKSIFSAVGDSSPKTYGSILFTMTTKLQIFRDPNVRRALTPPTKDEIAAGRRIIDFERLRRMTERRGDGHKRGTAVYIVVAEGEADRLGTVVSTFLAVAKDILKKSGNKPEDAYVLFSLDEAANGAKIPNLSEDFGVGRGRKMINLLGLQGISQLAKVYGAEVAKTIFENTGLYVIYPGAKDYTAEWTAKMLGKTTTLLRSASDALNDNYDSQKLTEHQRDLMSPDEIRQMKWYTQNILLINDAPPIRARINDDGKRVDPRRCKPRQYTFPDPIEPQPADVTVPGIEAHRASVAVISPAITPSQLAAAPQIKRLTPGEAVDLNSGEVYDVVSDNPAPENSSSENAAPDSVVQPNDNDAPSAAVAPGSGEIPDLTKNNTVLPVMNVESAPVLPVSSASLLPVSGASFVEPEPFGDDGDDDEETFEMELPE